MGSAKLSSRDVYESEKQVQRICDNFLWLSEFVKVTICQCFQFSLTNLPPNLQYRKAGHNIFSKRFTMLPKCMKGP